MAHINSLGAGIYSDLAIGTPGTAYTVPTSAPTAATLQGYFAGTELLSTATTGTAAGAFVRVQNIRDFPSIGIPANIVNVASYGSKNSKQVNGQPDAPTIELTLNYLPSDWPAGLNQILANMIGDGVTKCFRFTLLNQIPTGATPYASTVGG